MAEENGMPTSLKLSRILFLLGLPFLIYHAVGHYCICGHLAHDFDFVSGLGIDVVWVVLFAGALVANLFVPGKKGRFYLWFALGTLLSSFLIPILFIFHGYRQLRINSKREFYVSE
ncbi:MAG: hypothetical protein WCO56_20730 [Verrucomicrobiota bacterium]